MVVFDIGGVGMDMGVGIDRGGIDTEEDDFVFVVVLLPVVLA